MMPAVMGSGVGCVSLVRCCSVIANCWAAAKILALYCTLLPLLDDPPFGEVADRFDAPTKKIIEIE
jgi:hypothetical protein